ncbi:MAG: hypothetical protein KIT09_26165 [Bryobacteraceae bacterium]|nr:hypothetical protein [Bryobacteraceae bacterium]
MSSTIRCVAMIGMLYPLASPGAAGVLLSGQSVDLKDNEKTDLTMLIEPSRLRTNIKKHDADSSIIFLTEGDDYKMLVLDNAKKEYRVFDRKTIRELSDKIGGAMAQMQEQLKKMSPEQRAMVEKMMGKMGGAPAAPPPVTFTRTGADAVNGRPCVTYDGVQGGEKISEVCAAAPAALNLTPADMAVFEKMTSLFDELMTSMRQLPFLRSVGLKLVDKQIDGIPVRQVQFESGRPASRFEIQDSSRRDFSDADFSVGEARRVELDFGARGR